MTNHHTQQGNAATFFFTRPSISVSVIGLLLAPVMNSVDQTPRKDSEQVGPVSQYCARCGGMNLLTRAAR